MINNDVNLAANALAPNVRFGSKAAIPRSLEILRVEAQSAVTVEREPAMAGITVRPGEGETLNVLGMPLRFLCDADVTDGAWSLMEEDIPNGHGPPPHRHDWDEAYYVLSGALDFEMDGKPVRIEAGDFAYLPRNTVHAFKGGSDTPARVLIFATPAHSSAFFKDVNREVRTVPDDLGKIPEIGQRHGIEFMPPRMPAS